MTVIINAIVVTMDENKTLYPNGYLRFENDKIIEIGSMVNYVPKESEEVVDGHQGILMPGMVNTHTHLGMIPFRGLQDDAVDRLRRFLLPAEKAEMTRELVYASSKLAIAELLLSGVTTVLDMYFFINEMAKAAEEMKIRAFLGQTIIDEAVCDAETSNESLKYTENFIKAYKDHPLVKPCVAPHSTITCTENTLMKAGALSFKYHVPFTLHVAEMDYEVTSLKEKYNLTPVQFLDRLNLVQSNLIAVHCIYLNDADIRLLSDHGASVAHCIGSNTKAAKGVAPVKELLEQGVPVGLGTDGPASGNTLDIITQFKLFANFHKLQNHDRSAFPAHTIVDLGTMGGAKVLGIDDQIGSLEVGKQADMVLVETESVNMFPMYDPYSSLVYSANSKNVDTVYVAGQCLVKNKKLLLADLHTLKDEVQRLMTSKPEGLFNQQLLK